MMLELNNIPASPNYINAFNDFAANQQWILSLIRSAGSAAGGLKAPYYFKALDILQANGISTNPYENGSG